MHRRRAGTLQVNVTNCATGLPVSGAVSIDGNLHGVTLPNGIYSTRLAPGTYSVTVAGSNFTASTVGGIAINNGATTVANLCLIPLANLEAAGSTITAESCSPASGAIDPGETVTVDLSLKNIGTADTSNLVATLLATGGVTSPSSPQYFGNVVAGGSSVARSFTFTSESALACGGTLTATLQLQDGANDLGTSTFTFTVGALSNVIVSNANYSSGDIAVPILDFTTAEIPITVPDAGVIHDLNVRLRLNHSFDRDLDISLIHPDGTTVSLSRQRGGGGDNFGTGSTDCSGVPTIFDDGAELAISEGSAPFAGRFKPDQALSSLNGKPSFGQWKLRISDSAGSDQGTIYCAQLEISYRAYLCCPFTGGTASVAAAPPAFITAESCNTPNSAPDPNETVTMEFPLQNLGTGPTNNLVATLLPGGGVLAPSGSQNYGVLSPVGPPVSRPFTFAVGGTCGGTITATLQLQDGANNLGTVSFLVTIGGTAVSQFTFANPGAINILDAAPSAPYPSNISVSGVTGLVTKVTVSLDNFSHTFPSDVDLLLVGPGGQRLLLISDVGGGTGTVNADLTFDDAAPSVGATVLTGTFRPTNIGANDTFPVPAPPGPNPEPQVLSVFNGVDPNGTWSLYVVDDALRDEGRISGGWQLIITTGVPVCCESPCTLSCPADIVTSNEPGQCGAVAFYQPTTISGSCGVVSYSHASGSFFPVGTTNVTATAARLDGGMTTCAFTVTIIDPRVEVCDGADNNCNTLVDEGFPNNDLDGQADCVDADDDNDGIPDEVDNCPFISNTDQQNADCDALGDACDPTPNGDIQIVFSSNRDGNFEIYGMRADGTGVLRLTNNGASDLDPALSPDKTRILFTSNRDGNFEIYSMDASCTGVTRLTNNSAIEGFATWSPTGAKIAFTSTRDGNSEIYSMNADGTGVTRLTNHAKIDGNPAWSPDGRKIAFVSTRHGNYEIYSMNADGTGVARLTNHGAEDTFPTWSPDGAKIIFMSSRPGNAEIYVMNANGTGLTRLTNNSAIDAEPAWNATGKVAFTSTRDGNTEIYVMNADGTGLMRLTNHQSNDISPHW